MQVGIKRLTKRNSGKPLAEVIRQLNPLLRGFSQYFKISHSQRVFKQIASWLRRRLHCIQLKLWKKTTRLHSRLKQQGYKPPFKAINIHRWRNAASPLANLAMPNKWFDKVGLFNLEQVKTGVTFSYSG